MIKYTLKRISMTADCVRGVLLNEHDSPICLTLERPWQGNQHDVSCFPAGTYQAVRVDSPDQRKATPDNGDRFELVAVPGRSNVQIHVGNSIVDSKGCVLLGMEYGELYNGTPAVMQSRDAFKRFMDSLKGENEITLEVKEV